MHRFHLPPDQCEGERLELVEREAHHALQVLRLRRDDRVQVLDGRGQVLQCTVEGCGRDRIFLQVVQRHFTPAPACQITLLQALPKGKLFEAILQKSTELGVYRIVPLITERVVSHLDQDDALAKTARWRQVLVEAIKQCGSPWLPLLEPPVGPAEFLGRREQFDLAWFGSLQPNARHPRAVFETFARTQQRLPTTAAVWIGPEGDFSPAETELFESAGVSPVTLGPLVLRTETAALYCLSVLNYELQAPRG